MSLLFIFCRNLLSLFLWLCTNFNNLISLHGEGVLRLEFNDFSLGDGHLHDLVHVNLVQHLLILSLSLLLSWDRIFSHFCIMLSR